MRKISTLLMAFFVAFTLQAQTVLVEDFGGGSFPPSGWTTLNQPTNWRISQTANAGGGAPEGKLTWSPQFNTTTRFISPVLDLAGNSKAIFRFKQMIDHYASTYQIGVATRASEADDWSNAWIQTINANVPAQEKVIIIEDEDVNSATFQFCLFFTGNSYNLNDWYFDDFELFIPVQVDLAMAATDVPAYFQGERIINGTVTNLGLEDIASYDVNWSLNDGDVNTTSYTGLSLTTGSSHSFQSQQAINPPAGAHNFKIWISNVNGVTPDGNPDNDMFEMIIGVPTETMQRRPLFEEFTSSTCAPCASFNNAVFNPFIEQNGENIGLIKYQMNWPGSGDPYYTDEGGVRRTFYGVNAVPQLFAEGKNVSTNAGAVNTAYTNGMADPAFVHITATHAVDGNTFSVNTEITPYVDLNQVTLHVVFIEQLTTGNVASNGETSFKHVMMKMMPDANGTTMSFTGGETTSLEFSHDMTSTFVEEMDDLVAVVFIQDNSNKYIFNSAYSVDASAVAATVSFDPVEGTIDFPTEADLHINFNMPVYMVGGDEINNSNVGDLVTLEAAGGDAFPFTATINDDKTVITVSPEGLLDDQTTYSFGVADVQNANAIVTPASTVTFTTGFHLGIADQTAKLIAIAPNPVVDQIVVDYQVGAAGQVQIELYNMSGRFVAQIESATKPAGNHRLSYDASDIPSGIYMMRLQSNQTIHTSRIIISK